jgi:hypothetical protein
MPSTRHRHAHRGVGLAITLTAALIAALVGCAHSVSDPADGLADPAVSSGPPSSTLPGPGSGGGRAPGDGDGSISPGPGADDGGTSNGGGATTCSPGAAPGLAAPLEQWGWVADPAMRCGNGSATGFAINATTKSSRVLVFLMGGGGCYDAATCGGQDSVHKAAHLDGYTAVTAQQEIGQQLGAGSIFDRTSAQNPFRDYSYVFVPYCTGDFHAGSTVAAYGTNHVGATNMKRVLAQLVPTFCPAVSRVVLMGSSAGGFGAVFNYVEVAKAFQPVRVDLVDDSGPPMPPSSMPLQSTMRVAWGTAANAPSGCAGCASSWAAYLPFLSAAYPSARLSLLASTHDVSICPYFGMQAPQACKTATTVLAMQLGALPNVRVWMSDEFTHVFAGAGFTQKASQGSLLASFLSRQVNDDPSWSSVIPP